MKTPPRILVIPDGLAEHFDAASPAPPTTLAAARFLALDALARRGAVRRVRVTPEGFHAGSETGLPLLLGWTPFAPLSRGRIDAAAHGLPVPDRIAVHRVDVRHADGRPWPECAEGAATLLSAANPDHDVFRLTGHRLVALGEAAPVLPAPAEVQALPEALDPEDLPYLKLWPDGDVPPPLLDDRTVVVCAPRSTMAGVARLMGAETVHPTGSTGRPGTDIPAKTRAALALLRAQTPTVVIHVGSPDEAAHHHDPAAKLREAQRIDRDLIAPMAGVAMDLGALVAVCPDHGSDPRTGRHVADPVPAVLWGPGVMRSGPDTVTEQAVAAAPVVGSPWSWA